MAHRASSLPVTHMLHQPPQFPDQQAGRAFGQLGRFGSVGLLNTLIDIAVLNGLLAIFGSQHLFVLNALAYATGALNSYVLNRSWTFAPRRSATWGEVLRFALVTLGGIAVNDALLWLGRQALLPLLGDSWLATNAAKVVAICGTSLLSYVGLRRWVFGARHSDNVPPLVQSPTAQAHDRRVALSSVLAHHGISIVLPAFNEATVIATTVGEVLRVLPDWSADFEVIVVDDGSTDRTAALVTAISQHDARVRLLRHATNMGYGAALVTGFAAATKDLTCFMDADGQFTITDLARLLIQRAGVDAVIGYRLLRQDTWLRKVNAWGWNHLVRLCLGIRVRDLDCAFKLVPTVLLQTHPLTTRGAMINAELLFRLTQMGATYREVGVQHLPRQGGRATGARPAVILRALRDLIVFTVRWRFRSTAPQPGTRSTAAGKGAASDDPTTSRYSALVAQGDRMTDTPGSTANRLITAAAARLRGGRADFAAVPLWEKLGLGAILLLAAVLNVAQLTNNGLGNIYYATAVKSMLTSWHNFFFVAFDPGGFVTVDKPPLGLWVQAASAKLFGLSSLSLLLPEAIAGVLAVAVLYRLIRRTFGAPIALFGALLLAITPVSVIDSRDNILDSFLVLLVLLATWATLKAAETAQWRWLLVSAVLVGLAFNVKTLEAYLVVPALGLVYLLAAPVRWRTRFTHLALAGVVLLAVSLAWSLAVDLTPAGNRPYVGSSQTNSEINLALGYNGVQRITGLFGGQPSQGSSSDQLTSAGFAVGENGPVGLQRLFTPLLANEVSWFLPLALLGLLSTIWGIWPAVVRRPRALELWAAFTRIQLTPRQGAFVLWGTWLVTMGGFFSIANFFHPYYLNMLAPAVGVLAAVGIVGLWHDYQRSGWRSWLLPLALLATALEQWRILAEYPTWDTGLSVVVLLGTLVAGVLLIGVRLQRTLPAQVMATVPRVALGVGLGVLLVTPTIWSIRSWGNAGLVPATGPSNSAFAPAGASGGPLAAGGSETQADPKLVTFLQSHRGAATFLVATTSAMSAEPLILTTGQPVMALGGFLGSDKIVTLSQLKTAIHGGKVRYFLLQGGGLGALTPTEIAALPPQVQEIIKAMGAGGLKGGGLSANASLTSWVSATCTTVPQSAWSSTPATTASPTGGLPPGGIGMPPGGSPGYPSGGEGPPSGIPSLGGMGGQTLYDCAGAAKAPVPAGGH